MTTDECPHERKILEALSTGVWSRQLEEHAEACPDCAELVLVDRALLLDAAVVEDITGLPDAALIWSRFEIETGQRRVQAATLPIRLLEMVTTAVAILAALYGLIAVWPTVGAWLAATGSSLAGSFAGTSDFGTPMLMLLCLTGFLGVFLHGLYSHWAET